MSNNIEECYSEDDTSHNNSRTPKIFRLDYELIDQLLSFEKFDQKFWDQGDKILDQIVDKYFPIYGGRNYSALRLFFDYLIKKIGSEHHWYFYFLGISDDSNTTIEIDRINLRKSVDLGNPYAMVALREDDIKENLERYLKAYNLGLYKGLIEYISVSHYCEDEDYPEYSYRNKTKKKEDLRIKFLDYIDQLSKYNKRDAKDLICQMYNSLNSLFNDEYLDQYVKLMIRMGHWDDLKHEKNDTLQQIVVNYFDSER